VSEIFGSDYANAYDLLYRDKDYSEETRLIDRVVKSYTNGPVRRVLDLGCGTGNHVLPLAQLGYEVVGVDRSAGMLEAARKKAAGAALDGKATFHQADIRSFQVEPSFDVALMMFAVLGYQLENQDVLAALGTARKHLRSGGLFVFDVWYGPAVLSQGPTERVKVIPTERGQILRVATGELDIGRHLCKVSYRLWKIEDGRSGDQTEETHVVRYFFPLELKLFLESAGFASLRLGVFPDFDRDPDTSTWNVLGVARAV